MRFVWMQRPQTYWLLTTHVKKMQLLFLAWLAVCAGNGVWK